MSSINLLHSAPDPVKEASTPETLSLAGEESTFTKDYSTSCNSSKDGSGSGNTDNEPVAGCIPCSVEVQLDEAASETNNLATTVSSSMRRVEPSTVIGKRKSSDLDLVARSFT